MKLPLIDIGPLVQNTAGKIGVAEALDRACREFGFFYVINHGIDETLQNRLETASQKFFALPQTTKNLIPMSHGGRAWRGYFPVGGELTSGNPDLKEGIYFGSELGKDHPLVAAGLPLHGPNLFPEAVPEMKPAILAYLEALTRVGHRLMAGLSLGLGLDENYFHDRYTADPLILFRVFHYPPPVTEAPHWGVGEHTDYGVLTILKQDECGGLEVKGKSGWVAAPPVPNSFVCNLGDMLDRMTGGLYRSTAHRVKNTSGKNRLSYPFFFDPNFNSDVRPLPLKEKAPPREDRDERWDKASVHAFQGTYGTYLQNKIAKVFPELEARVLR